MVLLFRLFIYSRHLTRPVCRGCHENHASSHAPHCLRHTCVDVMVLCVMSADRHVSLRADSLLVKSSSWIALEALEAIQAGPLWIALEAIHASSLWIHCLCEFWKLWKRLAPGLFG